MSELELFKKQIIDRTHVILVREYGYSRIEANQLIQESRLNESIDKNPELFAHMTPDQVIDCVLLD